MCLLLRVNCFFADKCVAVKPRIDRDSFLDSHQLKRGQEFNVEVKFIGEPPPKALWKRADKVVLHAVAMSNCAWRFSLIHIVLLYSAGEGRQTHVLLASYVQTSFDDFSRCAF